MKARLLAPICAFVLAFAPCLRCAAYAGYPLADPDFAEDSSARQGSVDDYVRYGADDDDGTSEVPLVGIVVRDESARLSSGQRVSGIGVLGVCDGSPAAAAGLGREGKAVGAALALATVAAVMLFPPAVIAVAAVSGEFEQSRDVIISVDGDRTRSLMEFEQAMEKAGPGEIVYLTVIRGGHRRFFRIQIPAGA